MNRIIAVLLFTSITVSVCQYQRDFFVFTAHLNCTVNDKFRYQIQYFEEDLIFSSDRMTTFDNVGNGKGGRAIVNNFGVMYGDGFLDSEYEIYALILHDCTKNPGKMREYRHELGVCSTEMGGCRKTLDVDITELGDEVEAREILNFNFTFDSNS